MPLRAVKALCALLCCLSLSACFSSPAIRFYVLSSPEEGGKSRQIEKSEGPRVAIMPVILPGYLQRPQMVVREDDQVAIRLEDYHRWGEDLAVGIARVLSLTMTRDMQCCHGFAMPLRTGSPAEYRVLLDVRRFEGMPSGKVYLEAGWRLTCRGKVLRDGIFRREGTAGLSISDMVKAQSGLLEALGSELARVVLETENAAVTHTPAEDR